MVAALLLRVHLWFHSELLVVAELIDTRCKNLKEFLGTVNRRVKEREVIPRERRTMNKVVLGVVLGGILGIFDGLTAWLTPEARAQIVGIVIGSTFKGIIAGVLIGWFARKVSSLLGGILFGTAAGMFLAFLVAYMGGGKYYFEIMLPGSIVGLIVGYATQRYGERPQTSAARP